MRLIRLAEEYAVARAEPEAPVPAALFAVKGLVSVTRTADELSLVAPVAALRGFDRVEPGWCAFRVAGTLDFALTGVLAALAGALSRAGISLFAVSTWDTDYILVKQAEADAAVAAWRSEGHEVSA